MEDYFPGKFFYADYSAYTFSNATLRQDLDGGDRIHPRTAEGRQAIANFALYTSKFYCGASGAL